MSKKRRKGGGKAQKAKRRRKEWYAQSRGAPYKGQETGTSGQRPLPPDEEMMMDLTATLTMLMLRKRR